MAKVNFSGAKLLLITNAIPFMKYFATLAFLLLAIGLKAQTHSAALPHGMLFGQKVDNLNNMSATKVEAFMGNKTRISTTLTGKVIRVTKTTGGWFDMDAGAGKIIKVHFKNYGVNLPLDLKGHQVMIEGVAQKQFIADDMQHFAGDTVVGKKQHQTKTNPKQLLTFEATGLIIQ